MYCEYYEFSEKPFTVTPNPRFIFLSKNHQEAFAHLLYGIDNHAGFIELTGEIGTGKTTVLRTLLGQLDENVYRTALIFNPCLSATELLRSINREYGIPGEGLSNGELLKELNRFLLREKAAGRTVVLVIDESQNLEPPVLEQIRLISNLETETDKLIQIVLAGQPELSRLLERTELRQLAQRITVRYHLRPMDLDDTRKYISHRLGMVGHGLTVRFAPAALRRVFRFSGGIPRLINIVCDRALLVGYAEGYREITRRTVNDAIKEIRRDNGYRSRLLRYFAGVSCLVAILFASLFLAMKKEPRQWFLQSAGMFRGKAVSADLDTAGSPEGIRKGLADSGEKDSFLQSFNSLANLWKVRPVNSYRGMYPSQDINHLAAMRGLRPYFFKGNLKTLVVTDLPALLEFNVPGVAGSRYRALTGLEGDRLLIAPPLSGRVSFAAGELEPCWTGRACVLWKNFLNITLMPLPDSKGPDIESLQKMLAGAGYYNGPRSGVYDKATVVAVKAFQKAKGLDPDGKVGGKTLLFLYHDGGGFSVPRLTGVKGGNKG